ncbi:MAG: hypothetical protein ACOZF0_23750 [Thermodesulfobacteriota bacterium]
MNPREEELIRQWQASEAAEVRLRLITAGHAQDHLFNTFCEDLIRLAPRIQLEREGNEIQGIPGIRIGERITYQALPLGPELVPFLSALGPEKPAADLSLELRSALDRLSLPVFLKLFITSHCPHCPAAVERMISIAGSCDRVRLAVIDGALFPELTMVDGVQSAPTLVFDRFRWSGSIPVPEVVRVMADRNPADLGADTLQSILQAGGASRVAAMLREARSIFPAFLTLLTHSRWTVRLGAMVVMEELIETDRQLARRAAELLQERFSDLEETVRGDMMYLIGELGDPEFLPFLERIHAGIRNRDAAAAAVEAINAIRSKAGGLT